MGGFSARRIRFTINNPDKKLEFENNPLVRYCAWQLEKGEKCGTIHYQGYIEFTKPLTSPKIKEILGPKVKHLLCNASPEANKDYCTKDFTRIDGPWEYGTMSKGQGHRSDLDVVSEMVRNNQPLQEIATEATATFIRYNRGIERAIAVINYNHRDKPPWVYWVWGPTGVGKTKFATELGASFYMKDHTKWWDGYAQQETIIIDDFDGTWPFRDLLRLLDRYPYQGQYKGGYIPINSPNIVITCDRSLEECMGHLSPLELDQLRRRINYFKNLLRGYGYEVAGNTKQPPLHEFEEMPDDFDY